MTFWREAPVSGGESSRDESMERVQLKRQTCMQHATPVQRSALSRLRHVRVREAAERARAMAHGSETESEL